MSSFLTLLETVPSTLALQDALSNSVSGPGATGTAAPGTTGAAAPAGQQGPPPSNPFSLMGPLLLVMVFVIGFSMLTSRKEKKRREQLLASIKKGEKVLTIGGIIGTIADVRDDEVTLRVDENSNLKMRFTRSSIQQVLKSVPDTESGGASGGASGGGKGTAGAEVEIKTGKHARASA
jgi:preprotein translocase subunit YajC